MPDTNCYHTTQTLLAEHPEEGVRFTLARIKNLNKNIQEKLLEDKSEHVRRQTATHIKSVQLIKQTAERNDVALLTGLVGNDNTPEETLQKIFEKTKNAKVIAGLVSNPNTSSGLIETILQHTPDFNPPIASHPNCPLKMLEQFSQSKYEIIRRNVATNPNCPSALLNILAFDPAGSVARAAMNNPNCDRILKQTILDTLHSPAYASRINPQLGGLARNPTCEPEQLTKLYEYAEQTNKPLLADIVGAHPNCPKKILEQLAQTSDADTKEDLCTNPNITQKLLKQLASDNEDIVRRAVAGNKNCPEAALEKLAEDEEDYIRQTVAENPATGEHILTKLASDPNPTVKESVAFCANLSPKLARVRIQLLGSESTLVEGDAAILLKLAQTSGHLQNSIDSPDSIAKTIDYLLVLTEADFKNLDSYFVNILKNMFNETFNMLTQHPGWQQVSTATKLQLQKKASDAGWSIQTIITKPATTVRRTYKTNQNINIKP